jgi:hypothetical protein
MATNPIALAALSLFSRSKAGHARKQEFLEQRAENASLKSDGDLHMLRNVEANRHYDAAMKYRYQHGLTSSPVLRRQSSAPVRRAHNLVSNVKIMPEQRSSEHEIVLFGEPLSAVKSFAHKLEDLLITHQPHPELCTNHDTVTFLLRSLLYQLPGKFFASPFEGVHELRNTVRRPAHGVRMVELARISGAPLEFGYPSQRDLTAGAKPVRRTHRVNVLKLDETSFLAEHKRGLRRYSYSKLGWTAVEGLRAVSVEHELKLTLQIMSEGVAGQSAIITLDTVRSAGE